MLSGPSSSGKTTTAHLLRDYLTQYGAKSYIVSLDDFYRGVGLAPRLPDGEYNYESVEALDVEAIKQCLLDIITTGRFSVPSYNFALGRPTRPAPPVPAGRGGHRHCGGYPRSEPPVHPGAAPGQLRQALRQRQAAD